MEDAILTIRLTREEYERLREVAEAEGCPVEELGAHAVRRLLPVTPGGDDGSDSGDREDDPWLKLAQGVYKGGPPDGADNHDFYLYGLPKRR